MKCSQAVSFPSAHAAASARSSRCSDARYRADEAGVAPSGKACDRLASSTAANRSSVTPQRSALAFRCSRLTASGPTSGYIVRLEVLLLLARRSATREGGLAHRSYTRKGGWRFCREAAGVWSGAGLFGERRRAVGKDT